MVQKRIAIIDRDLCKPELTGYACMKACPINRAGKDCIVISPDDKKVLINEGLCIGCGICVKKCIRNAIKVVNLPEKLDEEPVHRYGKNLFVLFRLPIPRANTVVGLVGQNGMGKSTILNILSGVLKPNAGILDGEAEWDTIMDKFRGTELQGYLEKLAKKGVKAAYKPQHVDEIPRYWKGRVVEQLSKMGGKLDEIVKKLSLEDMLEKNISGLSGGELQLLAVAATILKSADFYFFDEPSSYLDVKERLLVAKEIRALTKKARVMVVEHDLAVADYLADSVHILYGQPGVFGIVSNPYGVRIGINTYLEGYIREENVRFRTESIVFEKRAKMSEKRDLFLEFPGFKKSFKGFSLETSGGQLYAGEVIGILGPNATGKTTFIKMLAGKERPDAGECLKGLRLAYKPQRLVLGSEEEQMLVKAFLEKRTGKRINKEVKKILGFLGIEKLLERNMGRLSGGELQSVLITSVLAQEKDIMLLDEPSAFLDVEQRLRVAKLLRDHVEKKEVPCFVVDHDLLFIDNLSDRVMVFSGIPGRSGQGSAPTGLKEGMNRFLRELGITFRRDPVTGRPRANKPGSQLDLEQKRKGNYYYTT